MYHTSLVDLLVDNENGDISRNYSFQCKARFHLFENDVENQLGPVKTNRCCYISSP